MDYTASIFSHEANFKEAANKNDLIKKLGLEDYDNKKPILFNILKALSAGDLVVSDK